MQISRARKHMELCNFLPAAYGKYANTPKTAYKKYANITSGCISELWDTTKCSVWEICKYPPTRYMWNMQKPPYSIWEVRRYPPRHHMGSMQISPIPGNIPHVYIQISPPGSMWKMSGYPPHDIREICRYSPCSILEVCRYPPGRYMGNMQISTLSGSIWHVCKYPHPAHFYPLSCEL